MSDSPTASSPGQYLRRLELAADRISDAVRRLKQGDRLWVLNAVLREALDEPSEPDQVARPVRRSSSTS
jgi:hypothetical protein